MDQAVQQCLKTLKKGDNYFAHYYLGEAYEQQRKYAEAIAEFRKAINISAASTEALAALGHAYAVTGQRSEAQKLLAEFDRLARQRYVSLGYKALIYIGLGETKLALDWLEKAYEERSGWVINLNVDLRYQSIRSAPRFQALVQRMKLPG